MSGIVIWVLSFVYLAAVAGWVGAAVHEGHPAEQGEAPSTRRRALGFAAMIAGATVVFAALIWVIEAA